MWQAIGDLLPSAIGVAISPVPIIAAILILGTPKATSNGPAFALGWVVALIAVGVIVVLVAGDADDPDSGASTTVNWVLLVLGLLFLVMAARQWQSRPGLGEEATMPKWMAAIDQFTPGKSLLMGLALAGVNPKNLALTLAAAATIAKAGLSGGETAVALAVFVVIGSLTVAGPVLFSVLAPAQATARLGSIKQFMVGHDAAIMTVLLLVLGAKMLGNGLGGLLD